MSPIPTQWSPTAPAIAPAMPMLAIGDTVNFTLDYTPLLNSEYQWESTVPSLISINAEGVAVAQAVGIGAVGARNATQFIATGVKVLDSVPLLAYDQLSIGSDNGCARRSGSRELACWPGTGVGGSSSVFPGIPEFVSLAVGNSHTCGLKADSTAHCWGENEGRLGDGGVLPRAQPTPVAGTQRYARITVGFAHTCGLAADSTAWCWGQNYSGQLGVGDVGARMVPAAVAGSDKYVAIDAGEGQSTCALRVDGTVRCWGSNWYGKLGTDPFPSSSVPTTVPSIPAMVGIDVGATHACALTAGGAAYCWGPRPTREVLGVLSSSFPTPRLVSGGFSFTRIGTGTDTACGLLADGDLRCWGTNSSGSVGDGTRVPRIVPRRVR